MTRRSKPRETLIQVRVPASIAAAAKLRAAQAGLPLSLWVRQLIRSELDTEFMDCWSVETGPAWTEHNRRVLADIDAGAATPAFRLSHIREFDGVRFVAHVFADLMRGVPQAGPLRWSQLKDYGTFRERDRRLLVTRGKPRAFWRIDSVAELRRDAPAWVVLVRAEPPPGLAED